LQPGELDGGSPPSPALTALRSVASAFLDTVWVVDVAVVRALYRYTPTGGTSLRYARAFSQ
jgi:hypothetical protein